MTTQLSVTSATFAFTAPALPAGASSLDIPIGNSQAVTINWMTGPGTPITPGTQVNFSTTRGTTVPANGIALTDAAGNASVTISSGLAGPAIITAAGAGVAATLNVAFVSQSAANVTVQAVPGTVAVTNPDSPGQANNTSTITATVRDGSGVNANLVKNAGIVFSLTDQTGGTISSGAARTDITGSASVTYTAGRISSAANGVTIRASVTDITGVGAITPVSSGTMPGFPDAALTVANQPLLVRLGTGNTVATYNVVNNQITYSAVVTDASGNASAGTTVRFALRPARYAKGRYFPAVSPATGWIQYFTIPAPGTFSPDNTSPPSPTSSYCLNEDINFNGILDPGEDFNGSGSLDPGGVATVTPSAVTDASGIATAVITYPKDHSYWTEVTLEARTGVVGNDPPNSATFWLPGPATDYNTVTAPPGVFSPYGTSATCGDAK